MKPILTAVLLVLAPLLVSCSSFPKAAVGRYQSSDGEVMIVGKDGALTWSPAPPGHGTHAVGILTGEKTPRGGAQIIVASGSPYLDTKVDFAADHSSMTVDWGDGQRAKKQRATGYTKQSG